METNRQTGKQEHMSLPKYETASGFSSAWCSTTSMPPCDASARVRRPPPCPGASCPGCHRVRKASTHVTRSWRCSKYPGQLMRSRRRGASTPLTACAPPGPCLGAQPTLGLPAMRGEKKPATARMSCLFFEIQTKRYEIWVLWLNDKTRTGNVKALTKVADCCANRQLEVLQRRMEKIRTTKIRLKHLTDPHVVASLQYAAGRILKHG